MYTLQSTYTIAMTDVATPYNDPSEIHHAIVLRIVAYRVSATLPMHLAPLQRWKEQVH